MIRDENSQLKPFSNTCESLQQPWLPYIFVEYRVKFVISFECLLCPLYEAGNRSIYNMLSSRHWPSFCWFTSCKLPPRASHAVPLKLPVRKPIFDGFSSQWLT
jgi:hypothetical protein